jgi:hypothetical protein
MSLKKLAIIITLSFFPLILFFGVKSTKVKNTVKKYVCTNCNSSVRDVVVVEDVDEFYEKAIDLLKPYDIIDEKKVRIGRDFDGGYVAIDSILKQSDVVLSYGVADDISFEEDLLMKYENINKIYTSDCSVEGLPESKLAANLLQKFVFSKTCIGKKNTSGLYKSDGNEVFKSLEEQIKENSLQDSKIFIKMDIEGGEYSAFDEISEDVWSKITGIVVETHWINDVANQKKFIKLISELNKNFVLINIHGNNHAPLVVFADYSNNLLELDKNLPAVIELSYISKKYVKNLALSQTIFPSNLDRNNRQSGFDYVINFHLKKN